MSPRISIRCGASAQGDSLTLAALRLLVHLGRLPEALGYAEVRPRWR
jgi:hypothetical protein